MDEALWNWKEHLLFAVRHVATKRKIAMPQRVVILTLLETGTEEFTYTEEFSVVEGVTAGDSRTLYLRSDTTSTTDANVSSLEAHATFCKAHHVDSYFTFMRAYGFFVWAHVQPYDDFIRWEVITPIEETDARDPYGPEL